MFTIIGGTFLLAFVHALIPNHWLPLVAVARAEGWTRKELTGITFFTALAHVLGTILLGLVLGLIGKQLEQRYGNVINLTLPVLLIVIGIIYYTVPLPHEHKTNNPDSSGRSRRKWILIFIIIMFLSPCLEVEGLFLSGGAYGMNTVLLLSLIYAVVSISGILFLVLIGFKGITLLKAHFIEHNEKKISGIVLILVGILTFFLH